MWHVHVSEGMIISSFYSVGLILQSLLQAGSLHLRKMVKSSVGEIVYIIFISVKVVDETEFQAQRLKD
jgi:exosome complex RNA-binding protein Rrp42 (RNase PH superfamily)